MSSKSLAADERELLEARYTFRRVAELELDPVRGNFDAAHLKEINRRIFQDLPGAGFDDVAPGEFRKPVATIGAYDAALKAQGIDETQRAQAVEQMRQSLAREVMGGRYPAIKTEQLRFPNAPEPDAGPEPTSGLSPG